MRVVAVCTANLCRSPLAEHVLRRAFADRRFVVEVASAGVRAIAGQSVPAGWSDVARGVGVDLRSHRSQPAQAWIADTDLFVVMTAEHARDLALVDHRVVGRVITLGQAVQRLEAGPASTPSAALFPDGQRGSDLLHMSREWDIEDPVRLAAAEQSRVAREIESLCVRLVGAWPS